MKVLEQGMDAVNNYPGRRYLTDYFTIALQGEDYGSVLTVCERYLDEPRVEVPAKEQEWLRQQKLNALIGDGRPEEAYALLAEAPENELYNEQRVLGLLAMKKNTDAVAYLTKWRQGAGGTPQILRLQVRAFRETGDYDQMNAMLAELYELEPTDPRTSAYAVIQQELAGLNDQARASLEKYFLRFGAYDKNLTLVAYPLAEIGEVLLLKVVIERANEQGFDRRPYLLLLAGAQLKMGDWRGALLSTNQLAAMGSEGRTPQVAGGLELATLLAEAATNPAEGPQVALLKHTEQGFYAFRDYRMIVDTMVRAERYEAALEMIARSERRYPRNQALAKYKTEAMAVLAEREEARPTAGPRVAVPVFVESAFFSRLDEAARDGRWSEATALIRDIRQARPSWLKSREEDVLSRQMRVAHGGQAVLEMTLVARLLLDGSLARSQIVVDFAEELNRSGDTADAVRLLKEVIRKSPNHALAQRLIVEWTTKPAAREGSSTR